MLSRHQAGTGELLLIFAGRMVDRVLCVCTVEVKLAGRHAKQDLGRVLLPAVTPPSRDR